jgi:hypothetical protein
LWVGDHAALHCGWITPLSKCSACFRSRPPRA